MAQSRSRPVVMKISESEVITKFLEIVKAFPEIAKELPPAAASRSFWSKAFAKSDATRRLMATFQEIPMFTCVAPQGSSRAAWMKVIEPQHAIRSRIRLPGVDSFFNVKGVPITIGHLGSCLQQVVREANRKPAKRKPIKRWRDRFGPKEVIQRVRPKESDAWLPNPHRGTTTFQQFQGDEPYRNWHTSDMHGPTVFNKVKTVEDNLKYIPRTTLTYCRWPWKFLEPKNGQYNWKLVDDTLRAARDRGQTVQIRFQPYTSRVEYADEPIHARRHPPERSVNLPDWYWETGAKWIKQGVYAAHEPDSNDPLYLKYFGRFIQAFGRRYDGHPDLESIDMAYAGFWGESGGNSTARTGQKLADLYMRAFKKTTLLSMLGTDGCRYAEKKSKQTGRPIGWRADCFGDLRSVDVPEVPRDLCFNHTFDSYPQGIELMGLTERWKTAPVTMETCGNVTTWFMSGHDLDFIIEQGYRYHMSVFMPKNAFMPEAWLPKLEAFDKKIGYRFVLRQARMPLEMPAGQKRSFEFFIENIGCAPIYRPYALALRFRQGKTSKIVRLREDIRSWMPGQRWFKEMIALPTGLKTGEVKVDVGIVDDSNTPKVWFAIEGNLIDGWHPLTSIDRR